MTPVAGQHRRAFAGVLGARSRLDAETRVQRAFSRSAAAGSAVVGPLAVCWQQGVSPLVDGGLCLLDGELDNHAAVAGELRLSQDVTAGLLLLTGWRRWGRELPSRLRGEFAFVVWDARTESGLIARDHLGKRALFWSTSGDAVTFATEVRHVLGLLPTHPQPERGAVVQWLASMGVTDARTLYSGVYRLEPASYVEIGAAGWRPRCYWRPRYSGTSTASVEEATEDVRTTMTSLVRRAKAPHAPTAIEVSGGLDSATIAALAAQDTSRQPIRLYTAAFPTMPTLDESLLVGMLAKDLGLEGMQVEVTGLGLMDGALEHITRLALPPAGWADFWEQPLMRQAVKDGADAWLTGDGGDEVMGIRLYLSSDQLRRGRLLAAYRTAQRIPELAAAGNAAILKRFMVQVAGRGALPAALHAMLRRRRGFERVPAFWLGEHDRRYLVDSDQSWDWKRSEGPLWWNHIAYALTTGVEELGVQDAFRRRRLDTGMRGREPLLGLDAVELALRLPPLAMFDRHRSRPLMRAAMEGQLLDAIRLRPDKSLFDPLLHVNVDAELPVIKRLMLASDAAIADYAEQSLIRELLDGRVAGRPIGPFVRSMQILRLAWCECWLRDVRTPGWAAQARADLMFSSPAVRLRAL